MTDSLGDFGLIELSMDKGRNWKNLNDTNAPWYNAISYYQNSGTYHVNQKSGDTVKNIQFTGNSDGWWFSNYTVNLTEILFVDSLWNDPFFDKSNLLIRFSMISDSSGNDEGWQIDKLCIRIDQHIGINPISNQNEIIAYPNPSKGQVKLMGDLKLGTYIQVISSSGVMVLSEELKNDVASLILNLKAGIYFVKVCGESSCQPLKVIVH